MLIATLAGALLAGAGLMGLWAQSPGGGGTREPAKLLGFGGRTWKTNFSEVSKHLKNLARTSEGDERVEIMQEVRNKYILVKRNDVLYRYNFYKKPWIVKRLDRNHKQTKEEYDKVEAVLFHVKVTAPLIEAKMITDKLVEKYQKATKNNVDKKKLEGVVVWELTQGVILQWVEPYQKRAFTRNIDYLSTDMVKIIMDEYRFYFDARERYILQKLKFEGM